MNSTLRLLICLSAGAVLCQCTSSKKTKKKEDASEQSLVKRTTSGVDMNKRSKYEKYMTGSKLGASSAGSYFQKQAHNSKNFTGSNSFGGQKSFKTSQSVYGRSKISNLDMTYALGNKQAGGANSSFKANTSRFGSQQAREGKSIFGGSDSTFSTGSALTRSKSIGRAPKIIENYNDKGGGKKSAYTEDEVRKLINRN